jgi:hypothetical protein
MWQKDNAIQGDLEAETFNPIPSTILKWFKFKAVSLRHDFQRCTAIVLDCLIVGLLWLHNNNPWRYSSDEPWPAEQPSLTVFPDCTRRYWVDMWSGSLSRLHQTVLG